MTVNRTPYPLALIREKKKKTATETATEKPLAGNAYSVNSVSTFNYRKDSPERPLTLAVRPVQGHVLISTEVRKNMLISV